MELSVTGMSCDGCEQAVEDALGQRDDVVAVAADHETDTVEIDGDISANDAASVIEEAGYEVSG